MTRAEKAAAEKAAALAARLAWQRERALSPSHPEAARAMLAVLEAAATEWRDMPGRRIARPAEATRAARLAELAELAAEIAAAENPAARRYNM